MLCTRSTLTSEGSVSLDLVVRSGRLSSFRDRRVHLASVVVHILNFPRVIGPADFIHVDASGSSSRLGRILLSSQEWSIEIQELPATRHLVERLKAEGGNAITHVARIVRADGRTFSIRNAERAVHALHQFLSFARGHTTSVFGATGFRRDGQKVYEEWATFPSTSWTSRTGWFDLHHAEALSELFPGFMRARADAVLGKALSTALYWYLRSNRGGAGMGTDGALILSQAALEGLALTCLTEAGLSTAGTAADRIRRGCKHWRIPVAVPKELLRMQTGKRKKAWKDGPDAITKVRNDLVHAKRRSIVPIGPAVPDTWRLAQWYLELAILQLCGYTGSYSNRLASRWVGEVMPVPWARKN
jgi:hypothetical protein